VRGASRREDGDVTAATGGAEAGVELGELRARRLERVRAGPQREALVRTGGDAAADAAAERGGERAPPAVDAVLAEEDGLRRRGGDRGRADERAGAHGRTTSPRAAAA